MAIYLFKGKSKLERSHIGQIIMSTTLNTQAKVIEQYGGTSWTKIEGRFLLGASSGYPVNATGGEATHTLTEDETAPHFHRFPGEGGSFTVSWGKTYGQNVTVHGASVIAEATQGNDLAIDQGNFWGTSSAGGGQPHNNMPPYKAVYIWERTA